MWEVECQRARGKQGAQERGFLPNEELAWVWGQGDRGEMGERGCLGSSMTYCPQDVGMKWTQVGGEKASFLG